MARAKKKNEFLTLIHSLRSISEEERALLLKQNRFFEKQVAKYEFKIKRIEKDRAIGRAILNATIADLEKNQKELEKVNNQLSLQQEKLQQQKTLIEENSQKLHENLKKLELSYKELEQFSYIASHDLKSPLRTIANFAQLLKRRYYNQLDQQANEYIDFIVSGAFHMNEVICNSLEYSKVGKEDYNLVSTNLNDVLHIVKNNLLDDITQNNAHIEVAPLPILTVNKTTMVQLFQNLIGNAIKFRRKIPPKIKITWKKRNGYYEFFVKDNGIGMDESYQKKAFLPFKRLNGQTQPGSGIGLAICKKIVQMYNGEIYYTSEKGKGTTFIFTLAL